jgi:uncharacterized pyridoxal phosphate-containing UPF0001 family protein
MDDGETTRVSEDPREISVRRLASVRSALADAALVCGRDPGTVELLAVSKGHPIESVTGFWELGLRDFGENYVQELVAKAAALATGTMGAMGAMGAGPNPGAALEPRWHFIGNLQTNKVKTVLPAVSAIHSLDRLSLLDSLARNAHLAKHRPVELYVQLEVDPADANKGGADAQEAEALCARLGELERAGGEFASAFRWVGFMGIGPADVDAARLEALYLDFRGRAEAHWAVHCPRAFATQPRVSLGMSGDMRVAIKSGSTCVRIGTALFGARKPRH